MMLKTLLLLGLTAAFPMADSDAQQATSPSTSDIDLDARVQKISGTKADYKEKQDHNKKAVKYPGRNNFVRTRDRFPREDGVVQRRDNLEHDNSNARLQDIIVFPDEYEAIKKQSNSGIANPKGDDRDQSDKDASDEIPIALGIDRRPWIGDDRDQSYEDASDEIPIALGIDRRP